VLGDVSIAAVVLSLGYGYTVGQRRLKVRRYELHLRDLPTALHGLRIAQISDIHIGENLHARQLEAFVARVNAAAPDLICITGDIVDAPNADLDAHLPILGRLQARHGVIAILGNHDHYSGAHRVVGGLERHTDFRVLRDDAHTLEIDGAALHIIGLDDRGRDWARGLLETPILNDLHQRRPPQSTVLLLSHRPDIFHQAARLGIKLTLSGHTHGGQLGLPWFRGRVLNPAWMMTAFDRGLFKRDGSFLYVNCGLGVVGQRLRLNTPREISFFELHSAPL
jgi:predicted MPP superfamily phosphohydrolase